MTDRPSRSTEELLNELQVHQIELELQNDELRKSQVALEESRDRYVDFYDFAPVGYITLNHEGMINEINLTGASLLGAERGNLTNHKFTEFVSRDDADRWHRHYTNVLKHDIKHTCEISIQRSDKSVLPVQLDSIRVFKENKVPVARIVLTDISERRHAEETLRKNEERFRSLVEQAADGIFVADSHGNYIDVNSTGCNMLGYSREEVLSMTFVDVLDPVEIPRLGSQLVNLARGELVVSEWKFLRKDGSTFIGQVRGKQLANGNFQGILIDITERIRTENAVRENGQRLKAHIENSPMAVVSWDKGLNVTQWAGEAENVFGWTEAETVGKAIMDLNLIYEEDIPLVQETMARILAAKQRYVISTNRNVTKDGRVIYCIWYNTILCDKDGVMESVMSLVLDVTERKQLEHELLALNNQLKHLVEVRTSDLSELSAHVQQIAEQERVKLARELHDELGSNMAAAILNLARLKGQVTDPKLIQELSSIKDILSDTVKAMRTVVSELYSTGLNTKGIIPAILWLVERYKKHTGIEVEMILPKEDFFMEQTFELAAYRITQECLTNVAKHAQASNVHIEIKGIDGFLDVVIHDNGVGLPDDVKTDGYGIFGMYERASYLGGSMDIFSDEKGTTAHLRLPLAAIKPQNRKRVLIVDDHAIVRGALRQLLSAEADDFSVEGEAADGKVALQMAIEEEWDIILLDVSLPNMDGIQVLEAILAVKPKQPIIMLSSHPKDEYAEIALSKGAACYIEKGETDKLVEEMRRATMLQ